MRFTDLMRGTALAVLLLTANGVPASAQQAGDATQDLPQTIVDGFRSAKFGMSEQDVRKAIIDDFHVSAGKIKKNDDALTRTKLLSVLVSDVLPNGGKATVSYLFGYHSHHLMSVIVTWATAVDPTVTGQVLFDNGNTLANYLRGAGYTANSIQMNGTISVNGSVGILLFKGDDVQGHQTLLYMNGPVNKDDAGHNQISPTVLTLQYVNDPAHPDIFRIEPGQF